MRFNLTTVARPVDLLDFSDLTDCNRTGPAEWVSEGILEIPFAPDPSPEEAARIVIRITSASEEDEQARLLVNDALVANAAFLNQTSPRTLDQIEAQVVALTGQLRAAYRLTIGNTP